MDFYSVPFSQKKNILKEYQPTNLQLILSDKLLGKIVYLKAYFPTSI